MSVATRVLKLHCTAHKGSDIFGWALQRVGAGMVGSANTLRGNIKPGIKVQVVQKADQRTGKLTEGVVDRLLTNAAQHPHGIKVKLKNGQVGRVKSIVPAEESKT